MAPVAVAFVGMTRLEVLKRTPVGAVELNVPLIVTVEPTMPLDGENVGTPGQVASGPVEYANAGVESSVPLVATTVADSAVADAGRDRGLELGARIDVTRPSRECRRTRRSGRVLRCGSSFR